MACKAGKRGQFQTFTQLKAEVASPKLEQDIRALVDPESQADPQLRNTFAYTRVREAEVKNLPDLERS